MHVEDLNYQKIGEVYIRYHVMLSNIRSSGILVWMHAEDLNYQKIGEALTGLEWCNKTTKCGNKESRAIIEST